jgi:hypothetical protein
MGISKAKITNAVNKAFDAAGELASTATLSNKVATSYSFASGNVAKSGTSTSVKVIITEKSLADGRAKYTALLKTAESIDAYDTLTVGSDIYNITDTTDNGFVITATLTKEA